MRLPLLSRRDVGQRVAPSRQGGVVVKPGPQRDHVVAASETVELVLGEHSPLPESAADVVDLVRLLRGHVAQLGARTAPGIPELMRAQRLCSDRIPEGYVPSRVYLVSLARATRDLMAHVERGSPAPISVNGGQRHRMPTVNVVRGTILALALACLVLAASLPWT
ncbi:MULTISPECIES: DUF6415 family natural product biosynthesis protein [unclassified Streptomyces]|uniref:DUF6415 family natural product biosynthesis protein n=1 Tax=unclassified Streptomyces TaxID=2593676 RepID=UPI000DC539CF|nr:DUF6415 family natural product biosynthesis protein [Streptomyces sp. PsTaAH-130]RAJ64083.1 hypothetical protein K376_01179 [Streptomyces sp. PsTaAH-130]